MFGRNKRIETNVASILRRFKRYDNVNFEACIRSNSIDIMHLSEKVDNLNNSIDEILEIIKPENISSKAIIAEAEERMQTLSDKVDALEADKRKLVAALGGAKSSNNKLRNSKKALQLDKKKLLKELNTYKKNGVYISKTLPPAKSKPQKTRLKNRVTNTQTKEILKDITSERVA